jgi:SH3-like domain-containing protein
MRFLIPFILLFLITGCKNPNGQVSIRKDIDSIVLKWIPDQREGICQIALSVLPDDRVLIKGETNIPEVKSEILNYLSKAEFIFSDSLTILPDTTVVTKPWGLITVSVCNIKKSPSHSSELVSQSVLGTPVKILKKRGGWFLIQTPDYYIGWANNSSIEELDNSGFERWKKSDRVIYIAKAGDLIQDPDNKIIVSDMVTGSIVQVLKEKKGYYYIQLPDGREGVLDKDNVSDFTIWAGSVLPDPGKLIPFSETLLGSPYLWGGTSVKALDCSGFVKIIFFTGGIILARDASLQYRHGADIDFSGNYDELKPGDLLFFGYEDEGKERIIHVGMYIGNRDVIHCSGMVRINSMDSTRNNYSSYLHDTFRGVRRIIGITPEKGMERVADNSWYFSQE